MYSIPLLLLFILFVTLLRIFFFCYDYIKPKYSTKEREKCEIRKDKVAVYIWLSTANPERKQEEVAPDEQIAEKHANWLCNIYNSIKNKIQKEMPDFTPGHVSIELLVYDFLENKLKPGSHEAGTFVSFGPKEYPVEFENLFKKNKGTVVDNYREDLVGENKAPDLLFYFHSLQVKPMIQKIKDLKKEVEKGKAKYALFDSLSSLNDNDSNWKQIKTMIFKLLDPYAWCQRIFLPKCPVNPAAPPKCKGYNCASMAMEIFHQGCGIWKLLGGVEKAKGMFSGSTAASENSSNESFGDDVETIGLLCSTLKSIFFIAEATLANFVATPDIFAEFMKQAKAKETHLIGKLGERICLTEEVEIEGNKKKKFTVEEWLPERRKDFRIFILMAIIIAVEGVLLRNFFFQIF